MLSQLVTGLARCVDICRELDVHFFINSAHIIFRSTESPKFSTPLWFLYLLVTPEAPHLYTTMLALADIVKCLDWDQRGQAADGVEMSGDYTIMTHP